MIIIRIFGILIFLTGGIITADWFLRENGKTAPLSDRGLPELPIWAAPSIGVFGLILTVISLIFGGKPANDIQAPLSPSMAQGVTSWEHTENEQVIVDDPAPVQPAQIQSPQEENKPISEAVLNNVWIKVPDGYIANIGDLRGGMDIRFVNLEKDGKIMISVADGRYKEPYNKDNWQAMVGAIYQAVHMTDTIPDLSEISPEERSGGITAYRIPLPDGEGMFMFKKGSTLFEYITINSDVDPDVVKSVLREIIDQFGDKPQEESDIGTNTEDFTAEGAPSLSSGTYTQNEISAAGIRPGRYSVNVIGDEYAVAAIYTDNTHTDVFRVAAAYPDGHKDNYTEYSPQGAIVDIDNESEIYVLDGTVVFTKLSK